MELSKIDLIKLGLLGLGTTAGAYYFISDLPKEKKVPIALLGLAGAGIAYYFVTAEEKKQIKAEREIPEKEEYITVSLPPIYLPSSVSETSAKQLINKLTPKVRPKVFPVGFELYWDPVPVDLPFGQIYITPPPRFLSVRSAIEAYRIANEFKPKLERTALGWEITFPSVRINI